MYTYMYFIHPHYEQMYIVHTSLLFYCVCILQILYVWSYFELSLFFLFSPLVVAHNEINWNEPKIKTMGAGSSWNELFLLS